MALPAGRAGADDWKLVASQDGVVVTAREVPGRGFPTFRGLGLVEANLYQVLAVLSDVPRHAEWMLRCADARQLRKISEVEYVVYSRTRAPWPVSDRDAVYHSNVHVDLKQLVVDVRFRAVKSALMPPRKGVVRMENLQGHYRLKALAQEKTLVDFQVDADPAGSLPRWVAKLATRHIPLDTILQLRRQVQKTRGWYSERIKRWEGMEKAMRKGVSTGSRP